MTGLFGACEGEAYFRESQEGGVKQGQGRGPSVLRQALALAEKVGGLQARGG